MLGCNTHTENKQKTRLSLPIPVHPICIKISSKIESHKMHLPVLWQHYAGSKYQSVMTIILKYISMDSFHS